MTERPTGVLGPHPHALARAIALWRRRAGLTQQELAERLSVPVADVRRVEDRPVDISPATLARYADALGVQVRDLTRTARHHQPGHGVAARSHRLVELPSARARDLLGAAVVGRVGFDTPEGPEILPVNYLMDGLGVALRTAPASVISRLRGRVAFEVDHLDADRELAWSVLVLGDIEQVTDPVRLAHLQRLSAARTWADDRRTLWMRITPARVTGRTIEPAGSPEDAT